VAFWHFDIQQKNQNQKTASNYYEKKDLPQKEKIAETSVYREKTN
jgi:hypothetical protein